MALEGSFHDMSLIDLFKIFRMSTKSGVLILNGSGKGGIVYVLEGQLVDAVIVSSQNRQVLATGEQAIFTLLRWQEATFIFRADSQVTQRPVRITRDSEALVLEFLRTQDEQEASLLPEQNITLDTKLELAPIPSSIAGGLSLDLDQWRLLSQISVSRDVRELCEKTAMEPEEVLRLTSELVAIGLIDVIAVRSQPVGVASGSGRMTSSSPSSQIGEVQRITATVAERGLLKAIMRRIRGL
jgi:hypothetical protein